MCVVAWMPSILPAFWGTLLGAPTHHLEDRRPDAGLRVLLRRRCMRGCGSAHESAGGRRLVEAYSANGNLRTRRRPSPKTATHPLTSHPEQTITRNRPSE